VIPMSEERIAGVFDGTAVLCGNHFPAPQMECKEDGWDDLHGYLAVYECPQCRSEVMVILRETTFEQPKR
jgi:DNA-directed RNA polymerase subunit RPC12/RpoP